MVTETDGAASAEAIDERSRALKERIYATFTGLSILAALSVTGHDTAPEALLALLVVGVLFFAHVV